MGSAGSVNNKPKCPYHRMCAAQIRKARNMRYTSGEASDFYVHCSNGNIDQVRQILEAPDRLSIDKFVKLERNGDTALHIATQNGHVEIVKLLFEHKCSRTILNRFGRVAAEEATTLEMQILFIRPEASDRFHDSATSNVIVHYLPGDNETNPTNSKKLEFFERFNREEDVHEYSLNHQTTAMWLRFYNWLSRTFPSYFQREDVHLDSFALHKNNDFQFFLREKLGEKYSETFEAFSNAEQVNSIKPLLTIYSSERFGFYRSLNRQLADSAAEADTSPHLCDRFIIEFHIRGDELEKRSYIGTAYRGATINANELLKYEKVCEHKPRGVIAFKAFTSTSEDKGIALRFIRDNPPKENQIGVLFIIEIKLKTATVVGMSDASDFPDEKEVLFLPGNLYVVKKIVKDVDIDHGKKLTITEIHLEYLHIPISVRKKLLHTYRSAKKNSVT